MGLDDCLVEVHTWLEEVSRAEVDSCRERGQCFVLLPQIFGALDNLR